MSTHKKHGKKRMNMGGSAMGGGRGMGLPPGLAKRLPKGLADRLGGMPKGLQPRPERPSIPPNRGEMTRPGFAAKPMKMAAGGKVRGAGAAKRGLKISKKMG